MDWSCASYQNGSSSLSVQLLHATNCFQSRLYTVCVHQLLCLTQPGSTIHLTTTSLRLIKLPNFWVATPSQHALTAILSALNNLTNCKGPSCSTLSNYLLSSLLPARPKKLVESSIFDSWRATITLLTV